MKQRNFVVFTASAFLFLIVFFTSSLIANQENPDKPSIKRSNPQSEISNPPSVNSNPSNLQSTIQNLSSTSIGEPKFEKADVLQKTKKLQIPFIANEGQTDEKVAFYANTFGGSVFVTKDGEIVYSLPSVQRSFSHDTHHREAKHPIQTTASERNQTISVRVSNYLSEKTVFDIFLIAPTHLNHLLKRGDSFAYSFINKNLVTASTMDENKERGNSESLNPQSTSTNLTSEVKGLVLKEEIVGGKINGVIGEEKTITKVSDFRGKDPSKWKANISTYEAVTLGEIYDGIELKLKAYGDNIEKLFYVKPGADMERIRLRLSGGKDFNINTKGELEVKTELGTVKFTKPIAYQEIDGKRVDVSVEYRIQNPEERIQKSENEGWLKRSAPNKNSSQLATCNSKLISTNQKSKIQNLSSTLIGDPKSAIHNPKLEYGFKVASYDKTKPLIIDPLLASTYLGASGSKSDGSDYGNAIAIDTEGNVYVTGYTDSFDFPTTTDAYNTSHNSNYDVFISKLSGDLTSLLASTYLGGSDSDYGNSVAIDSSGNVHVAGDTESSDFPTTAGAYDTFLNGAKDAFVAKLNGELTTLLASTFLGGSSSDYANSTAIDSSGNVYVTGYTYSSDFPTSTNAYDTSGGGGYIHSCYAFFSDPYGEYYSYSDIFISKLSNDLSTLQSSTYFGGSSHDNSNSLLIDSSGDVYVSGYTSSSDFPTTSGAYSTSGGYYSYCCADDLSCDMNVGYSDVFISKFNGELSSLILSTCLGTSGNSSFEPDSFIYSYKNNIVIDSIGNIYVNGGNFVSKLNGELTTLLASTFLGGSSSDYANSTATAIDSSGNVYVTGYTYSSDFPTSTNAYDTSYNNSGDAFISKLNSNLTSLLASTFLGGSSSDSGNSIAIDSDGNIYITGKTTSSNFPMTTSAYDVSYNGGGDAFISKLNGELTSLLASTYLGGTDFYYDDYGHSITIDSSGSIYISGYSNSSYFPMDTETYDTSYNGSKDIFVSKFSGDLTSLLASTYLGGANSDYGHSISIGPSGILYVTGYTNSSDFPTTIDAYDTSYNGNDDVFVSKLSGDLTSLLASTYLGGSDSDHANSITIDASGNVCVAGYTYSSDFPTTTEAYDISYNDSEDVFLSKLSGDLTTLLASTYLGGSNYDNAKSIAIDSNGNVYVTGYANSSGFPTTIDAYDTSYNGNYDVFVTKLSGDLTNLLASTFLGGYEYDYGYSISTDLIGNVYVSGYTSSPNFPISPVALHAYYGDNTDAYISKLNNNLTNLLSSSYIKSGANNCIKIDLAGNIYTAGSSSILKTNNSLTRLLASASLDGEINSLALDSDGNIYVAGYTDSTEFQTTTGAYDTYNVGDYDAFITKFNDSLFSSSPTVTTGTATGIISASATLNGSVNANGASTNAWFEYDTTSGSYSNTTSKQSLSGLNGTDTVSIHISRLSQETTYYCRLVGQNSFGTTYGSETSFTTKTPSAPTVITGLATNITYNSANLNGYVNADESLTTAWFEYGKSSSSYSDTSSTLSVSGSDDSIVSIDISDLSLETTYYYRIAAQNSFGTTYGSETSFTTLLPEGIIVGYVSDTKGNPLKSVKLILEGKKTLISNTTFSFSNGFFAFYGLGADTYFIKASKKGYKRFKKKITLEAEEEKEIKIKMKRTRMRALE